MRITYILYNLYTVSNGKLAIDICIKPDFNKNLCMLIEVMSPKTDSIRYVIQ